MFSVREYCHINTRNGLLKALQKFSNSGKENEICFVVQVCMSVYSVLGCVCSVSRDVQRIEMLFQLPIMLNRLVVAAETAEGSPIETD